MSAVLVRTVYFYYHYYYKLQIVFRCGHEINFGVRGCNKKRYYLQYISVIKSFAMQYKFFSLCGQTFLFFLFQAWTFHNTATFVNGLFYTNSLVSVCVCVHLHFFLSFFESFLLEKRMQNFIQKRRSETKQNYV